MATATRSGAPPTSAANGARLTKAPPMTAMDNTSPRAGTRRARRQCELARGASSVGIWAR
jgi:hypothetical protein